MTGNVIQPNGTSGGALLLGTLSFNKSELSEQPAISGESRHGQNHVVDTTLVNACNACQSVLIRCFIKQNGITYLVGSTVANSANDLWQIPLLRWTGVRGYVMYGYNTAWNIYATFFDDEYNLLDANNCIYAEFWKLS